MVAALRTSVVALILGTGMALLSGCATQHSKVDPGSGGTVIASGDSIGKSRKSRPLTADTVGHGPLRIYLVGGIHGNEPEGQASLAQIRRDFDRPPLNDMVTLRVLNDMNPDGTAARTRTSSAGVDLNRNWPATNFRASTSGSRPRDGRGPAPLSEPETAAAHTDIVNFDPHIIVALHSTESGPFVNYDGPAAAKTMADRFAASARAAARSKSTRWRVVPEMGYPTPGSMGSYFGRDRGLPILTIEFDRGTSADDARAAALAGLKALATDRALVSIPLSRTRRSSTAGATLGATP